MDKLPNSNQVVLLTAAVSPSSDVPFTSLDAGARLPLYRDSFKWWTNKASVNGWFLYVVETTGATSEDLFEEADIPKNVIFRPFSPPPEFNARGKGALESACLDFAYKDISKTFGDDVTVHKVTGRLKVLNSPTIFTKIEPNKIKVRRALDRRYCDSRVFSLTARTWAEHFTKIFEEVNDLNNNKYFEHVLSQRIILGEYAGNMQVLQFPKIPKIRGLSGTTGNPYGGLTWDGWNNAKDVVEQSLYRGYGQRLL